MPTKREYLVSKGLAKAGRGRFKREAVAELERARQSGITFDDEDGSGSSDPDSAIPLPGDYIPPKIKNYPVVRDLKYVEGYTEEGYKVQSACCFRCGQHVSRCPCSAGITASKIVARWDPEHEKYGKPIDVLATA
jgi:hypothetical protein